MAVSYTCADYPGMEACPGRFQAESADELWHHIEAHATIAHGENPAEWAKEDRDQVTALIRDAS